MTQSTSSHGPSSSCECQAFVPPSPSVEVKKLHYIPAVTFLCCLIYSVLYSFCRWLSDLHVSPAGFSVQYFIVMIIRHCIHRNETLFSCYQCPIFMSPQSACVKTFSLVWGWCGRPSSLCLQCFRVCLVLFVTFRLSSTWFLLVSVAYLPQPHATSQSSSSTAYEAGQLIGIEAIQSPPLSQLPTLRRGHMTRFYPTWWSPGSVFIHSWRLEVSPGLQTEPMAAAVMKMKKGRRQHILGAYELFTGQRVLRYRPADLAKAVLPLRPSSLCAPPHVFMISLKAQDLLLWTASLSDLIPHHPLNLSSTLGCVYSSWGRGGGSISAISWTLVRWSEGWSCCLRWIFWVRQSSSMLCPFVEHYSVKMVSSVHIGRTLIKIATFLW